MTSSVSPFSAGLACRCPGCGRERLFDGYRDVAQSCASCGLELRNHDAGNGLAVFVILIVAAAFIVEVKCEPPVWLHLVIWILLIFVSALNLCGFPNGGQRRVQIFNDHHGYAITWYILATALALIYLLFSRQKFMRQPMETLR